MKARICDRCKTVMPHKPIVGKGRPPIVYSICPREKRWEDDTLRPIKCDSKCYDICEDCLKDFYKFMEGEEFNEN